MNTESTSQSSTAQVANVAPKTYQQIEEVLRSNHLYPSLVIKSGITVALQVQCPATILMDSKVARLKEILEDYKVKVSPFRNEGFIEIKIVK